MRNKFNLWKLFTTITVILSIVFIYISYHTYKDVKDKISIELTNINQTTSKSLISFFQYDESLLSIIGNELLKVNAIKKPEKARKLIEEMIKVNQGLVAFGLAKYNGQLIIVSTLPPKEKLPNLMMNIKTKESFNIARNSSNMQLGRTYYMNALKHWVIPIRKGIKDKEGKIPLVFTAGIKIQGEDTALNIKLPKSIEIQVVRNDRYIQFQNPLEKINYKSTFNQKIDEKIFKKLKNTNNIIKMMKNKEEYLVSSLYLKQFDLYTVVSVPMKKITEEFMTHFMIIILIFLLLITSLYYVFKKNITEQRIAQKRSESYQEKLTKEVEEKTKTLAQQKKFFEEKSNTFFSLSVNLLLISDIKGNIIQVNKSCKRILGYSPEELQNMSFIDLLHPEDKEITINEMSKLSRGEVVDYFENRYKHKNGSYITLSWSANTNTSNTLIYTSAQDVTNIKKKDELIYQQSKMASMGEMIENIAHQWRQPLSIVTTISTAIKFKNELDILEKDEVDESMENMIIAADHLNTTITNFIDFFKEEKKQSNYQLEKTFERTFGLLDSQFKSAGINIIKNISNVKLFGNENEMIQVFMNILNNARDELIKLKDSQRLIFIDVISSNKYIDIIIKDNAGGIPSELISEIFNSHFTTKEESNGTGIGLYMSKMIVNEHIKGDIFVKNINYEYQNIQYKGAEFTIKVPFENEKELTL